MQTTEPTKRFSEEKLREPVTTGAKEVQKGLKVDYNIPKNLSFSIAQNEVSETTVKTQVKSFSAATYANLMKIYQPKMNIPKYQMKPFTSSNIMAGTPL